MQRRDHAQRQHIIHSLDSLLYQLHVLSFFMSPSVSGLLCRLVSQTQCSRPRMVDPNRSLRFWFGSIVLFNATSLWHHAKEGAVTGKTVVLDFIGMAYVPSKLHLLLLDVLILLFQFLLVFISYETSLSYDSLSSSALDPLLPFLTNATTDTTTTTISPSASTTTLLTTLPSKSSPSPSMPAYIIDVRLAPIFARLRHPPPPPPPTTDDQSALPLPNTVARASNAFGGVSVPQGLGLLMRASAQMRRAQQTTTRAQGRVNDALASRQADDTDGNRSAAGPGPRSFPGSMDLDETDDV